MHDAFLAKIARAKHPPEVASFFADAYRGSSIVPPNTDIIRCRDEPDQLHVLVEGWAYRYRLTPVGDRQIAFFRLPGEIINLERLFHTNLDVQPASRSTCRVQSIPVEAISEAMAARSDIRDFVWSLVSEANVGLVEHVLSVKRTAQQRLAYLFVDTVRRLQHAGLAEDGRFQSVLTQNDLADSLGLSVVHVNRSLKQLRAENLLEMHGRCVSIPDVKALEAAAKGLQAAQRERHDARWHGRTTSDACSPH